MEQPQEETPDLPPGTNYLVIMMHVLNVAFIITIIVLALELSGNERRPRFRNNTST